MPKPRFAGQKLGLAQKLRLARGIPFIGDLIGMGFDLANPDASPMQRVVNAGLTGGGGILATMATGGLDFIPQVVDTVNDLTGGPKGPEKLRQLQACATVYNPDRHFGALASRVGPDKYNKFYETDFPRAVEQCGQSVIPSQYKTEEEKTRYLQYLGSQMGRMF